MYVISQVNHEGIKRFNFLFKKTTKSKSYKGNKGDIYKYMYYCNSNLEWTFFADTLQD